MHFKLLTNNKMKRNINHKYLNVALIFSGDINLNPKCQINDPKFEVLATRGFISYILILTSA